MVLRRWPLRSTTCELWILWRDHDAIAMHVDVIDELERIG